MVEVKGKIAAGDSIVVQGAEQLEAGQKVRTVKTAITRLGTGRRQQTARSAFSAGRDRYAVMDGRIQPLRGPGKSARVR